jgi:hypothetical protein
MSARWIDHSGKQIFLIDYSACKNGQEMIDTLNEAINLISKTPGKVLRLIDVRGASGSREFMDAAKRAGKEIFNAKTEKAAIVGISGIQKVLLMGYNNISTNKLIPFSTLDEALDFLAK